MPWPQSRGVEISVRKIEKSGEFKKRRAMLNKYVIQHDFPAFLKYYPAGIPNNLCAFSLLERKLRTPTISL